MYRILSSFGLRIISQFAQVSIHNSNVLNLTCRRSIYTAHKLGIGALESLQEKRKNAFSLGGHKEKYMERLKQYSESSEFSQLLRDDLINLIGLADKEEHLDLLENMVASGKIEDGGGWGSMVARLYYSMNLVDRAFRVIQDPNPRVKAFFHQSNTYMVIMTMLFDAGRYDDVIAVYELCEEAQRIVERRLNIEAHSALVFASYAKIGTPEALQSANQLFESRKDSVVMKVRIMSLLAYLNYKNGEYTSALNIICDGYCFNSPVAINLKLLCFMELGRYEDAIIFLGDQIKRSTLRGPIFSQEVFDKAKAKLVQIDDDTIRNHFTGILNDISESKILNSLSLEQIVFKPIDGTGTKSLREFERPRYQQHDESYFPSPRDGHQSRRADYASDTNSGRQARRRIIID